jgi:hypothetical protein
VDQIANISNVVGFVAGLAVATERVTEFIKNLPGVSAFLSTPQKTRTVEDMRVAAVHVLAAVVGALICWQMPPEFMHGLNPRLPQTWATYAFFGVLASGGAGFWNSALDTFRAVKTTKQALQAASVAALSNAPAMQPAPSLSPSKGTPRIMSAVPIQSPTRPLQTPTQPSSPSPSTAGSPSFQYFGGDARTIYGPITGRAYSFVGPGTTLGIDPRDAPSMLWVPNLRRVA